MSNKIRLYQYASKGNWSSQSDKHEVLNGIESLQSEVEDLQARVNGWISIDQGIPAKHMQKVKTKDALGREYECYYMDNGNGGIPYFKVIGQVWDHSNVTHWMPFTQVDTVTG